MNLASWIILAVVAVILGLAVKLTFVRKRKGSCHECSACSHSEGCPHCRP